MEKEVHIRSEELCERCIYGQCGQVCLDARQYCGLDDGMSCKCDEVEYGTPCPYFKESAEA